MTIIRHFLTEYPYTLGLALAGVIFAVISGMPLGYAIAVFLWVSAALVAQWEDQSEPEEAARSFEEEGPFASGD